MRNELHEQKWKNLDKFNVEKTWENIKSKLVEKVDKHIPHYSHINQITK